MWWVQYCSEVKASWCRKVSNRDFTDYVLYVLSHLLMLYSATYKTHVHSGFMNISCIHRPLIKTSPSQLYNALTMYWLLHTDYVMHCMAMHWLYHALTMTISRTDYITHWLHIGTIHECRGKGCHYITLNELRYICTDHIHLVWGATPATFRDNI